MHPSWFFTTTEIRAKVHLNTSQSQITTQAIDRTHGRHEVKTKTSSGRMCPLPKNYSTVKPVLRGLLCD
jgi:hypothetical protein